MKPLVINCSLNADSRAYRMAESAVTALEALHAEPKLLDLRELQLPLADPTSANARPDIRALQGTIEMAPAVLLAVPVYAYDISAATKNLLELTGRAWNDKIVALLSSAGSRTSYLAATSMITQLLLENRCLIVPRVVLGAGGDFEGSQIVNTDLTARIRTCCALTLKLAGTVDLKDPDSIGKKVRKALG